MPRMSGRQLAKARVERLEVDDPTYGRAHLVAGTQHWTLTFELDPATSKLSYVRFESEVR